MFHVIAAVLALSDPLTPVVDVRIDEVLAEPERYAGQTLRIRGQIDACYRWVCSICPEEMNPATADQEKCLGISFDGFEGEAWENDPEKSGYSSALWRELERAFRFSVVTADGKFDPSCLPIRPSPDDGGIEAVVVCTDRASTWRGVQVRAVHRRLPSNDGLLLSKAWGGVLRTPSQETASMAEQAYREYERAFDDTPDWKPVTVIQTENPILGDPNREAWACVCRIDDCAGRWPRREISLRAPTVNDPYFCYFALERGGAWRLYPE